MRSSVPSRIVVVLAATLTAAGCGLGTANRSDGSGTADGVSETHASTTVGGGPGSGGTASATPTGGDPTGSTDGGSTGGGQPAPKPSSPAAKPPANGPRIGYFRVRQQPTCPAGTNVNPIPGTPVVLEWQAANVDRVALSVDGPGIYRDSYAPTDTETLNFPCSGAGGDTQQHTYQLTVSNADGRQTRTITVSARVNDIPAV